MARSYTPRTAPDPAFTGWPKGIKYIIGNEGCERFSYYGMRAILYVYIVGLYIQYRGLGEGEAKAEATATYHLFAAGVYALPMIGAMLADRLLGKYRVILVLSLVYCAGHAALAFFENPAFQMDLFGEVLIDPVDGLLIGLALIAVGSGGIKPCVSAHVGDQFGTGNWSKLQSVFNAFYFIINFGSAFATIIIPELRGEQTVDPVTGYYIYDGSVTIAFAVPGILMGLATFCFWLGRKEFVHVPPTHPGVRGLLDVLIGSVLFIGLFAYPFFVAEVHQHGWASDVSWVLLACFAGGLALFYLRQKIQLDDGVMATLACSVHPILVGKKPVPGPSYGFGQARAILGDEAVQATKAVLSVVSVFAMVSVFWALFDQHGSTWIEQAKMMDRSIVLSGVGTIAAFVGVGFVIGFPIMLGLKNVLEKPLQRVGVLAGIMVTAGVIGALVGDTNFTAKASQIQTLNPVIVMILIPLTMFGIYPLLDKLGFKPTPLRRMTMGMSMAALAFVAVALIQARVDDAGPGQVHVVWQFIPYVIITLAEVMVSITGLEFGYSQAPKRMKSVIMGFWLLGVSVGNILVAFIAHDDDSSSLELEPFFWKFALYMGIAAGVFALRAAFYTYKDQSQG